ncbi:hypothetical protein CDAR_452801 [Caerostris darwini]|uniref:Uncharacterized protein n=1 Tax=Caerostris darwini TaxID=1538125 RepID=A0AAV4SIH3_9ARAC|nr:hypothetical protein CDAR_452801 [Caerostris darwini]
MKTGRNVCMVIWRRKGKGGNIFSPAIDFRVIFINVHEGRKGKKILTSELEVVLATRCLGLERGAVKSQTSIEEDFRLSCAGTGLLVFISLNN